MLASDWSRYRDQDCFYSFSRMFEGKEATEAARRRGEKTENFVKDVEKGCCAAREAARGGGCRASHRTLLSHGKMCSRACPPPSLKIYSKGSGDPPEHIMKGIQGEETKEKPSQGLRKSFPNKIAEPKVLPLLQFAWDEYLQEKKKELKGETWEYPSNVMCFIDGQLVGDEKQLLQWAYDVWDYEDFKPVALYEAITQDFLTKYMRNKQHVFVYFEISIQAEPKGKLLFELYSDICPRTCKNFQYLCSGEKKKSMSGLPLTYRDSIFHRLVKNGWIQGGDIRGGRGTGGESIYGPFFEGCSADILVRTGANG
uniref:probable inactive peptidyl-prolyl cis-trans isomerase-like 6 isoform X5 n=1 Tax=Podarcis muralis TaxID=64176 RepID=UPI00109FD884|nr:probable inactive peptidyl-prolyl cis-trans isomerase-like 6 isoform X5 [Podarcis muralis]